jgi:hypothetical protein
MVYCKNNGTFQLFIAFSGIMLPTSKYAEPVDVSPLALVLKEEY